MFACFHALSTQQQQQSPVLLLGLCLQVLYPGTYAPNLDGCHVEMGCLGQLLHQKQPKLWAHLQVGSLQYDTRGCWNNLPKAIGSNHVAFRGLQLNV
jgi:hypothetical protein